MGMKPLITSAPMKIKGACTNPKARANVGVRGQASMQKGSDMETAQSIRNAISKPKR